MTRTRGCLRASAGGESPLHVDLFSRVDAGQSERLLAGFRSALQALAGVDGRVSFEAPYVVVTTRRK